MKMAYTLLCIIALTACSKNPQPSPTAMSENERIAAEFGAANGLNGQAQLAVLHLLNELDKTSKRSPALLRQKYTQALLANPKLEHTPCLDLILPSLNSDPAHPDWADLINEDLRRIDKAACKGKQ